MNLNKLLKNKAFNGWRLFWLISIPISVVIFIEMMATDTSTGEGVSHMISYSVRFAIPFIFLVMAASAMPVLFPGTLSLWWLHNRRYIGMCFAVAMAWQGAFIFTISTFMRDYYFEEIYFFRDELEGTIGYIFLLAMVLTTFQFGRKYVNPAQWKLIHKSAVYFLFAYAFSVYWWNLSYYPNAEPAFDPRVIDYIFYWMGFLAFSARIAAWGKLRLQAARKNAPGSTVPLPSKIVGGGLVAFGVLVASTGLQWQGPVTAFLTAPAWSEELVVWLPYWPLEPYFSLFIVGLGTMLATMVRNDGQE